MSSRRHFITLLGGTAVAWPLAARAQLKDRIRHIGVLMLPAENDPQGRLRAAAFQQSIERLGWTIGNNIAIDYRWNIADISAARIAVAELLKLTPDVLLANGSPALPAAQQATKSIPIVFTLVNEPVAMGYVASLAHPGGNVTGFSNVEPTLGAKWLDLLKEIAPRITRVAMLFNPATAPYAEYWLNSFKAAAASFAVQAIVAPVHDTSDLESVIAAQAQEPNGGLIVMPDTFTTEHRSEITSLAAQHRLPAVYPYRIFAEFGGLLSYGDNLTDNFRRAASYVDRILKGEKPAELPVQAPTRFELTINLKAARALGISVLPSMIARADQVLD
jgi:ABC-type uncharacterized transport system substrate-binding protein